MDIFVQSLTPFLEITIIAILLNYLLSFFWNTRSMDLMLGVFAFLLIFAGSSWLNLPILQKIMLLIGNVAVIAVLIIFQPELRVALSKLSVKGKRHREITEFDKFLEQLSNSIFRMGEKRIGALIVLEHENALEEYAQKGIILNAQFSTELLETIFMTSSPLHDGAVILRGRTIVAAGVILPLAEDSAGAGNPMMGTRHRAGLGISQNSDALVIVVSEESGKVSMARDGIITRGIKVDRFKGVVRSLFTPPEKNDFKKYFNVRAWAKE